MLFLVKSKVFMKVKIFSISKTNQMTLKISYRKLTALISLFYRNKNSQIC